ncbi:UNKNOWN [Stylonychia lemnae]|uniref:PHR domain-containing protein n=1 Tax=Stylonychia lemnae TaxID=5949 RepID=A0A077ZVF1_STYLE|nr:UNKNOWN [Stylonychia lemnae]|eukprot:CDW72401.1 UNKNOWN [Stylonychia lemnae]
MYGVRTDQYLDGDQIRFFQRFQTCKPEGGWEYYGLMDGIKILCHESILFKGVGIFASSKTDSPEPFTLTYRYQLIDQYGDEIYQSELIEEEVQYQSNDINELHFFKYIFKTFPKGIKVEKGQTFCYQQQTSMAKTFYSDSGREYESIQNQDMGIFNLKNYEVGQSYCTISCGVIPGFLYQFY